MAEVRWLHIVCGAATLGAAVASYRLTPWLLLLPLFVAALAYFRRRSLARSVAIALMPAAFWCYASAHDNAAPPLLGIDQSRTEGSLLSMKAFVLVGRVEQVLRQDDSFCQFVVTSRNLLFPYRRDLCGKLLVNSKSSLSLAPGNRVEISGSAHLPENGNYPWDFDYAAYLKRKGIACTAQAKCVRLLDRRETQVDVVSQNLEAAVCATRRTIVSNHQINLGSSYGDLLSSMVLGDRIVEVAPELTDNFRHAGLSHVLAASGFNLSLVTGMTWCVAGAFIHSQRLICTVVLFMMGIFVLLAGPSPSVIRAAIMITVVMLGRAIHRSCDAVSAICAALFLTLLSDPAAISDVGLQLSYVTTFGIVCGTMPAAGILREMCPFRLPGFIPEAVCVTGIAQLSVLPLQISYFWQFGMLALPANLLASPLIPIITTLGFCSSLLSAISFEHPLTLSVCSAIDALALYPLQALAGIAGHAAGLEWANIRCGPPVLLAVLIYYIALALLMLAMRLGRHVKLAAGLCALALASLFWRPPLPALSLAIFDQDVVIIDGNRHYWSFCLSADRAHGNRLHQCEGGVSRKGRRLLDYFAANEGLKGTFVVQHFDAGQTISGEGLKIPVFNSGARHLRYSDPITDLSGNVLIVDSAIPEQQIGEFSRSFAQNPPRAVVLRISRAGSRRSRQFTLWHLKTLCKEKNSLFVVQGIHEAMLLIDRQGNVLSYPSEQTISKSGTHDTSNSL